MIKLDFGDDIFIWNTIDFNMGPMLKVAYLGNIYQGGLNLYSYRYNSFELPENYFDNKGNSSVGYYETPSDSSLDIALHIFVAVDYPNFTQKQLNLIYGEAYDSGHSAGESEVNSIFKGLCEFVNNVIKA